MEVQVLSWAPLSSSASAEGESSVREVHLELRIHAPGSAATEGTGQVFWKGGADVSFDKSRSVYFSVPNDGQVHVHRVALAGHPLLPDEVQWLRIDPVNGPCEVDLLSLRLA
ncbi:MAG: hypothetical protein VXY92_02925 [Planctomycetota bacterium]|nr:hypothetical protein [Planctomycetota bacterium]